jgi:iron complex outermembrane recepter protein
MPNYSSWTTRPINRSLPRPYSRTPIRSIPTGAGDYYINCSNPLLSAQQQSILCTPAQIAADTAHPGSASAQVEIGRRNIEGGPRETEFEHINYRAVFGTKGDFADAWSYDAYGQYFYTSFYDANEKYLNFQSIANALQVTGTAAHPVCISGAIGCVPYNIFSDGGVTPQQLAYLYELGTANGTSTLRTLHADVTGKLGQYGMTHRRSQPMASVSTSASSIATITSIAAGRRRGKRLAVGLRQRRGADRQQHFGFGGVRRTARAADAGQTRRQGAAVRYRLPASDYTTVGEQSTYKFEVQFAPIADYRFRASYDKAIRAPSIAEAFTPPIVGQAAVGRGSLRSTHQFSLIQCERTGVTPAQYNNGSIPQGVAAQLSQQTSGNPALKPEQGTTYTIGVNFAPSQIPHLTGSIDYYHIQIKDEIGVSLHVILVRVRQHRQSDLLQPDRAPAEHRQSDRQQQRRRRVCHSRELQSGYRAQQRLRCAAGLHAWTCRPALAASHST